MNTPKKPGHDPASTTPPGSGDEIIIDLTDSGPNASRQLATVSSEHPEGAKPTVVIDLRDPAISDRVITPGPAVSGRPPALLEGHRVELITGGARWMDAEAFVYERYVKIGFTNESSRRQVEELARWADQSRFHAVVDQDDRIVGTVRTILGSYNELPVGQFERFNFEDRDPVCEFSSLVVDQSVRSSGVLEHLFRTAWADALRLGATAVVGLVDAWLLEVFRRTYALPFVPVAFPHHHMGGDVIPVVMEIGRRGMSQVGKHNPRFWEWSLEALTPEEIARHDLGGLIPAERPERNSRPLHA